MKVEKTPLPGVLLITPKVFGDARGFFMESFNARAFEAATGVTDRFVQDNHSLSARHVLRGLHYQLPPMAQGKLVRVTAGEIFDVAVDVRQSSPTFRQWFGCRLSADNFRQLWIPAGFAHGFLAMTENTQVQYKTTHYYAPDHERSLFWADESLGIDWPDTGGDKAVSAKDAQAPRLNKAELFK
ncbi:MAG: dTDP-4-dehydrorhamnose 3,5-epimerase [Salinisphaeraceae bacterium]|nr:dTDP-4-dehydrorhamnose 3,5-epimerase [Salinisphaeraceae bacterium]